MTKAPRLTRTDPAPAPGIVHLGPGAFFRAFVAPLTAKALADTPGDWGIRAVSLRTPDVRDRLAPQDWAYTSVTLAPDGERTDTIQILTDILVAPEDPEAVLQALADPATKIVTLTVTEKGYCHNPATRALILDHPDIAHDLAHPDAPRSAPGFLAHALNRRRQANEHPFTVLSCDNLPENGPMLRGVVLAFARALDPTLADWIETHVRFPATMVDRITPATTQTDIDRLARTTGTLDEAPVLHEPFAQWVIEDDFPEGRPAWETAGVQMTADVTPFELMKLRLLNGSHSALAYLGYLAGHETISDTIADPAFADYAQHLWAEIKPAVPTPPGEDLTRYCDTLLARYANPAIRHRTWQIAMDGSQKLPQRLLGTIADNIAAERTIVALSLAVAAWMRYIGGTDEKGDTIDVRDPLADHLRKISDDAPAPAERVAALLAVDQVFAPALARNDRFRRLVTDAYAGLIHHGARAMAGRVAR